MMTLALRRLLLMPLLLWVIYTFTFALAWLAPGNPLQLDDSRKPPKEIEERLMAQYNLNDPAKFYWQYLFGREGQGGVIRGDFGPSLRYRDQTVSSIIVDAFPVSFHLGMASILLALLLGVGVGVAGAVWRGSLIDTLSTVMVLAGISLPTFVIGSLLMLVFCLNLGWVPIGWGSPGQVLLPALTLALPFAAYFARLTRMGMLEALQADHVRTARAKGVAEHQVVLRHALKLAALPVVSFLGPAAAAALTGSFVVEQVFNVPGLGQHFVAAVQNKDLFLIMGVVLLYSSLLIAFNLLVDLAYHLIDPRIETAS